MQFDSSKIESRIDLYNWAINYVLENIKESTGIHMKDVLGKGFCFLFKMVEVDLYGTYPSETLYLFRTHVPELYKLVPKTWSGIYMFPTDKGGWTTRLNLLVNALAKAQQNANRS